MPDNEVIMGSLEPEYKKGKMRVITFCVTEECNLRCKYCYMTEKNSFNRMSIAVAKKAVDYFLSQPPEEDAVVWDFIGGEPTLEMQLIDEISDYIKQQLFLLDHPWFSDYIFNIGTNGILYRSALVQDYLKKNEGHVTVSITIDGIKEKHDLMRVKADGSGSYDEVLESVKLWLQQYPGASTKVTFASDDLKYLKDSIVHLWDIGLERIPANIVFEDVWKEGDDIIYEEQLKALADYVVDNRLYFTKSVRFFDPSIGFPMGKKHKMTGFCGTGKMVAVDPSGHFYPCIRFLDFCIPNKPPLSTGSIYTGYNTRQRDAFKSLTIGILNDGECVNCPVASGCFSCTGCNYANADEITIFHRTKYHCAMQKAQVRANEYFWNRFTEVEDQISPHELKRREYYESEGWTPDGAKFLYFIIDENCTPICHYRGDKQGFSMSTQILEIGLEFAKQENMVPVFIGNPYRLLGKAAKKKLHIVYSDTIDQELTNNPICEFIPVYNEHSVKNPVKSNYCIYTVTRDRLDYLPQDLETIGDYSCGINLKFLDVGQWEANDYSVYAAKLAGLDESIRSKLNVIKHTNRCENSCRAGVSEFTLAPNGKLYHCPGYYYEAPDSAICTVDEIEKIKSIDTSLYDHSKSPKCTECANTHCEKCTLKSFLFTGFANLPAVEFCNVISTSNSDTTVHLA